MADYFEWPPTFITLYCLMIFIILPGLQGQDEVLFQFCDRQGWRHAEHVGTITPYQAWLALKKLGREDYDVTKVRIMVMRGAPADGFRCADAVWHKKSA